MTDAAHNDRINQIHDAILAHWQACDVAQGIYSPGHDPYDTQGRPIDYCGECGRIASCNPDNDICANCETGLRKQP